MKFHLLFALALSFSSLAAQEDGYSANYPESGVVVITRDTDGPVTNIRSAAGGKVACTVSTDTLFTFIFTPGMQEVNGWIRIPDNHLYWYDETDAHSAESRDYTRAGHLRKLTGSKTGYWIHNSVLRLLLFPDIPILREPRFGAEVIYHTNQLANVRPISMQQGWVKVKTIDGKFTGWVEEGSIVPQPLLYNTDCSCGEGYEDSSTLWHTFNQSYHVNGGVGICQFVDAMGLSDPEYPFEDPCYDARNGYFNFGEEGDGHIHYQAAIWNRTDGRKLFIISWSHGGSVNDYESGEFRDHDGPNFCYRLFQDGPDRSWYFLDSGYQAYLYDTQKKMLIPLETSPFRNMPATRLNRFLELPREGKDILVNEVDCTNYETEYPTHLLKWNGMSFDFQ